MSYNIPPRDDRSSSYPSPNSSNRSYFTEQAIRSGYSGRIDLRETEFQQYGTEFQRYGTELRGPVERDTERDRIRAEIMEKEMARRRILEEEIRMELMLDREVAMQRWEASRMRGGDTAVAPPSIVHEPSRVFQVHPAVVPGRNVDRFDVPSGVPQYVHESSSRIAQPLGHYQGRMYPVMPMGAVRPVVSPYQHHVMPVADLGPRDIKYPPENRKETSMLAMREANNSGPNMKRKALTLGADRPGGSNLGKKPRLWTCELCKISTTNERGLNDHLRGKKHKQMVEEGLPPVQKIGIGSSTPSDSEMKKAAKAHVKRSESNSAAEATVVDKKQISRQNSSVKIQRRGPIQKPGPPSTTPIKVELAKKAPSTTPFKGEITKKFKYWCKICKVGANSEVVLAAHQKGKRHLGNIQELQKAAPGSSSAVPPRNNK